MEKTATHFDQQALRVLKALYNIHNNIFNRDDVPHSEQALAHVLGISAHRVRDVCGWLTDEGLVQTIDAGGSSLFVRITPKGVRTVEAGK